MARTSTQVISDLSTSVETIDPTIDTVKGPFRDQYIAPFGTEISDAEVKAEDLNKRYSTSYVATLDTEAIDLYIENHGIRRGEGTVSTGWVHFYAFTAPGTGDSYPIPQGTVVSDRDGLYAYQVVSTVTMEGDRASSYYNPARRWYEIPARIEALAAGDAYDLPPGRITKLLSDVNGISGVEQRLRVQGGEQAETNEHVMERVDAQLHGNALGSMGGIDSTIRNSSPDQIDDVAIVYSSDIQIFTRRTSRPAMDAYVIGTTSTVHEQLFTASGGEVDLLLERVPVQSITSVLVNNSEVTNWEFLPDTTDELGTSARANDIVRFDTALIAGDEVLITFSYNTLIRDLQNYIEQPFIYPFETDILCREAIPVGIEVQVSVTLLSTYDPQLAESTILSALLDYCNPDQFREFSYADDLRTHIASKVPYATQVQVLLFKRADYGVLDVEVIELQKNQYPYTDSTLYDINIESTT